MHTPEQYTPAQAARLREISFSVSAAEMLAAKYDTEPEVAASCSMLRQFGMALIAWN